MACQSCRISNKWANRRDVLSSILCRIDNNRRLGSLANNATLQQSASNSDRNGVSLDPSLSYDSSGDRTCNKLKMMVVNDHGSGNSYTKIGRRSYATSLAAVSYAHIQKGMRLVRSFATMSTMTTALLQQYQTQLLCNSVYISYATTSFVAPTYMIVVRNNCGSLYSDISRTQRWWFVQQCRHLICNNSHNSHATMAAIHINEGARTRWLGQIMCTQRKWSVQKNGGSNTSKQYSI